MENRREDRKCWIEKAVTSIKQQQKNQTIPTPKSNALGGYPKKTLHADLGRHTLLSDTALLQ